MIVKKSSVAAEPKRYLKIMIAKDNGNIKIKAESLSSLSAKYGVARKTMKTWLTKAKLLKTDGSYLYTPKEVAAIYEHLGNP